MRFSVLTARNLGNWKASRGKTLDEARAVLFEPARLEHRLRLLEELPLRCFDHQSNQDFQLFILTSSLIGKAHLDRLHDLTSGRPYLKVRTVTPDSNISMAARRCVAETAVQNLVVTFRIDDDDGVHPAFIDDLHRHRVKANFRKIVSCDQGLFLKYSKAGFAVKDVIYPNNAFGLAFVSGGRRTIYDTGSHFTIPASRLIINPRPRAWIRSLHGMSDSGRSMGSGDTVRRLPVPAIRAEMPEYCFLRFEAIRPLLADPQPKSPILRHVERLLPRLFGGRPQASADRRS